jgi:hypothetical protein
MRFDSLRAAFRAIAAASVPAAVVAGCCAGFPPEHRQTFEIDPDDARYAPAVADCRVDDHACEKLCRLLIPPATDDTAVGVLDCVASGLAGDVATVRVRYVYLEDCSSGRRPPGLRSRGQGSWLARAAHLEAASVPAFVHLARELVAHGAPALSRLAVAAARDEVRHARVVGGLARRGGGAAPTPAEVGATPLRELEALAIDNAVEGCVGETFAALIATRQARAAADPAVRAAYASIADDETRHAALSLAIDRWARRRLDAAARRRVAAARAEAIAGLAAAPELTDAALGLPDPRQRRALWRACGAVAWA